MVFPVINDAPVTPSIAFSVVDGRVEGDLPLPLHHMARLWCPRISCLLPQFPLEGPGVRLTGPRARALGGALQRRDRTLRDLRLGGHLPGPGENKKETLSLVHQG